MCAMKETLKLFVCWISSSWAVSGSCRLRLCPVNSKDNSLCNAAFLLTGLEK